MTRPRRVENDDEHDERLANRRTSEHVDRDLDAWRREMEVVLAEVNLASGHMRLYGRRTTEFTDAETAQHGALRRLGDLDRRREELQAEARVLQSLGDGARPSPSARGTTYMLRGEAWADLVRLADALMPNGGPLKCNAFSTRVTWDGGLPHFEMTVVSSHLPFDELLAVISVIPDGHVMYETVQPIEHYRGDRDWNRTARGGSMNPPRCMGCGSLIEGEQVIEDSDGTSWHPECHADMLDAAVENAALADLTPDGGPEAA